MTTIASLAIELGLQSGDVTIGVANAETKLKGLQAMVDSMDLELDLDIMPLEESLAKAGTQLDLFKDTFGQMELAVGLNDSELLSQMAVAQEAIEAFTAEPEAVQLELDIARFEAQLVNVGDQLEFFRSTVLEPEAKVPLDIPVTIDSGPAIAEMAVLETTLGAMAAKGGGGRGLGGILWGGGGGGAAFFTLFGLFNALPGIFTVASLAGLGFEHVLTTLLGLAGSLAGAIGGGLILALGTFSVAAVGFLTDMAGIGQAAGDIKQYGTLLDALNKAAALSGKNSAAYKTAQYNMDQFTQDLAPSTVKAIAAANATAGAFHAMFDSATSSAETTGAKILNQAMLVGMKFLPTIGKYAGMNMSIIQKDIQPLFAWLGTTGVTILNNIESIFTKNLPTGIDAMTQAIELFLKIVNYLAPMTGNLMKSIDDKLKYLNTDAGFDKVKSGINDLIGMFHVWWNLIKQVGITIYDIFSQSKGLGTSIAATLTTMLQKLDSWLTSTTGKAQLSNLFTVHLQEVQAILGLLPTVLGGIGQMYLILAPPLTVLFTMAVNILTTIAKLPTVGPFLVWLGAIALFASRMKVLAIGGSIWSGIKDVITMLQALGAGAGFTDAIKIAFGSTSAAVQMQTAVTEFGLAVDRFVAGSGIGTATGVGEGVVTGAVGAGTVEGGGLIAADALGAIGGLTALAGVGAAAIGIIGLIAILNAVSTHPSTSPLPQGPGTGGSAKGTAKTTAAYAATWNALLDSANAAYAKSGLFTQNLTTDLLAAGIPMAKIPRDIAAIESAYASGKIKTESQLISLIEHLTGLSGAVGGITVTAKQTASTWQQILGVGVGTKHQWKTFKDYLEPLLKNTLVSTSNLSQASDDISILVAHHKITNASQLAAWETEWNTIQTQSKGASSAQTLMTGMIAKGQLNLATQGPAFIAAWNSLVNQGVAPASISGIEIQENMALIASLTAMWASKVPDPSNLASATGAHGSAALYQRKPTALGGWINEPVIGTGMYTGSTYSIAENQPEYVNDFPLGGSSSTSGGGAASTNTGGEALLADIAQSNRSIAKSLGASPSTGALAKMRSS